MSAEAARPTAAADDARASRAATPQAVACVSLPIPGHGGARCDVQIRLARPQRGFEQQYSAALRALDTAAMIRQLHDDPVALKKFQQSQQKAAASARAARDDEPDEADEAAAMAAADADEQEDGDDASTDSAALRLLKERLRTRRPHPYWLPPLLAGNGALFSRVCQAMYGWAVPPPPLPAPAPARDGTAAKAMAGAGESDAAPVARAGAPHAVSFSTNVDVRSAATVADDGDDDDDGSGGGSGAMDRKGKDTADDSEDAEDDAAPADPARKPSNFFCSSGAFSEPGAPDDGVESEGVETSRRTRGARLGSPMNEQADDAAGGDTRAAAKPWVPRAPSASIVPVGAIRSNSVARGFLTTVAAGRGGAAAQLASVPAFADADYPLYLARSRGGADGAVACPPVWYLLDVHPRIMACRAQREAARRAAATMPDSAAAAAALVAKAPEDGEELSEEENGDDGDDGNSNSSSEDDRARAAADTARDAAVAETQATAGEPPDAEDDDDDDDDEETLDLDEESIVVVDATMLAALCCPHALRIILLQSPKGAALSALAGSGAGDVSNSGSAEDEAGSDGRHMGGGTSESGVAAAPPPAASGRRCTLSLVNLQWWMDHDLRAAFPVLSALYAGLLSTRKLDAPRLPYVPVSLARSEAAQQPLALDFAVFFTCGFLYSLPQTPLLLGHPRRPTSTTTSLVGSSGGAAGTHGNAIVSAAAAAGGPLAFAAEQLYNLPSPRSEYAVATMQALLTVGVVPSHPLPLALLTTPESVQLAVWLLAALPPSVLRAWAAMHVLASTEEAARSAADGDDAAAPLEEDDDVDEDDDGAEDAVDVTAAADDHAAERAVCEQLIREARRAERADARAQRRAAHRRGGPSATPPSAFCDRARTRCTAAAQELLLPGPLLAQTILEVQRRMLREAAGQHSSAYALGFALEKPLGQLRRAVENGKLSGDPLVTAMMHPYFLQGEPAQPTTSAAPVVKSITSPLSPLPVAQPLVAPPLLLPPPAPLPSGAALQQQQLVYQSDLVLLLLALTSTPQETATEPAGASNTAGSARQSPAASPSFEQQQQQQQQQAPGARKAPRVSVVSMRPRATSVANARHALSPPPPSESVHPGSTAVPVLPVQPLVGSGAVDGHTDVFAQILHMKLARQRGGRNATAAALLRRVRSGTFRLLLVSLPRFSRGGTAHVLCDAAPLYDLLGCNECCPLADLVLAWSAEEGIGAGVPQRQPQASLVSLSVEGPTSASVTSPADTRGRVARALYSPFTAAVSPSSSLSVQPSAAASALQTERQRVMFDTFVNTFWSEIVYRLEAGLYPESTVELLRLHRSLLLQKVYERRDLYIKVVSTLMSGKMLRHSLVHRALLAYDSFVGGGAAEAAPGASADGSNGLFSPGAGASAASPESGKTLSRASSAFSRATSSGRVGSPVAASPTSPIPPQQRLIHVLSCYSEEFRRDQVRVSALFDALPMAPRTVYTPELLHALLAGARPHELDVVAVRYVMATHHVSTVRRGGPFAAGASSAGRADALLSTLGCAIARDADDTAAADCPAGVELPALEYALQTHNAAAARLLVILGGSLDAPAVGGACTVETMAERCLCPEEVEKLRRLCRGEQRAIAADPDRGFGSLRVT